MSDGKASTPVTSLWPARIHFGEQIFRYPMPRTGSPGDSQSVQSLVYFVDVPSSQDAPGPLYCTTWFTAGDVLLADMLSPPYAAVIE